MKKIIVFLFCLSLITTSGIVFALTENSTTELHLENTTKTTKDYRDMTDEDVLLLPPKELPKNYITEEYAEIDTELLELAKLHSRYRFGEITKEEYINSLKERNTESSYINKMTKLDQIKTDKIEKEISNKISLMSYTENYLNAPWIKQQNGYYCGPCSALIALKYVKSGYSKTQQQLATLLNTSTGGTDWNSGSESNPIYPMQNVMRSESNLTYSTIKVDNATTDLATFKSIIMWAIDIGRPVIANGYTGSGATFNGYSTEGHWLIIRGYTFGTSAETVEVVDPAYGVLSNAKNSIFSINASAMRNFILYKGIVA